MLSLVSEPELRPSRFWTSELSDCHGVMAASLKAEAMIQQSYTRTRGVSIEGIVALITDHLSIRFSYGGTTSWRSSLSLIFQIYSLLNSWSSLVYHCLCTERCSGASGPHSGLLTHFRTTLPCCLTPFENLSRFDPFSMQMRFWK